jgi:MFS family permease
VIQAGYALSILIMEVPSGYLAGIIGRKKALILGAVFLPVGAVAYAVGRTFLISLLAKFIIAIGNSMRSGCDSSIVYDALKQLNKESNDKRN